MAPCRLRKIIGLIDEHLAAEEEGRIALRSLAEEVKMSYFHFSRTFKQSMGMTLTGYIAQRRIERAKRLMQEIEIPIAEIALRSGFFSQSSLTVERTPRYTDFTQTELPSCMIITRRLLATPEAT